jgi:NitT/TauT family transport system permease protein
MKRQIRILGIQSSIVILLLAIWETLGKSSKDIFFLVGSPSAVAEQLWGLCISGDFFKHFLTTAAETVCGFLIGMLMGSSAGLSLWFSETAARIARPFVITLGAIPIFAFAPLMIVWFGVGFEMKVAIAAFSSIFIAFSQAYKGANSVASEYIDPLRGMNASKLQIFQKVILPGSLDWVFNSFRLCISFSLLGAFIGEYISSEAGLGWLILRSSSLYDIPRALVGVVGICVLSLLLDFAAQIIERYRFLIIRWISVPKVLWHR